MKKLGLTINKSEVEKTAVTGDTVKKGGGEEGALKESGISFPTFKGQFEYFDISGNKILMDDPVCRFFLSS